MHNKQRGEQCVKGGGSRGTARQEAAPYHVYAAYKKHLLLLRRRQLLLRLLLCVCVYIGMYVCWQCVQKSTPILVAHKNHTSISKVTIAVAQLKASQAD